MRSILATSVVLALLFAIASASIAFRPHAKGMIPEPPKPKPNADQGKIFEVVQRLFMASENNDYDEVSRLIADNATVRISELGCGDISKADALAHLRSDNVANRLLSIKGYTESCGMGIFAVEVVVTFNTSSKYSNKSFWQPTIFVAATLSADGSKLDSYMEFSDRAWAQNNATEMIAVFTTIAKANEAGNVAPYQAAFAADSWFVLYDRDATEPLVQNKSTMIAGLTKQFSTQTFANVYVDTVFAVCDKVVAELVYGGGQNDGTRMANKYYVSLELSPTMQVNALEEFSVKRLIKK